MNVIEKLAANPAIKKLIFSQFKTWLKDEKITILAVYLNANGEIDAKQYTDKVVIIKLEDYERLKNNQIKHDDTTANAAE